MSSFEKMKTLKTNKAAKETRVNAHAKEFSFSEERELKLKPHVAKQLLKDVEEAKSGKNLSPGFDNVEDAIAWLKA